MTQSQRYESDDVDAAPLGRPLHFEFSGRTAPNRFLKAAMTERISSWDPLDLAKRGIPSKNLINVYKRWGEGQLGVLGSFCASDERTTSDRRQAPYSRVT